MKRERVEIGRKRGRDGRGRKKEINERKCDTMGEGPGWGTGSAVVSLFPSLTLIQQQRNF